VSEGGGMQGRACLFREGGLLCCTGPESGLQGKAGRIG